MKLHNYFRSSASYRVRIALALKELPYEYIAVHLVKGEQRAPAHAAISPDRLVPVLEVDGHFLPQSMAIIEYLDERHPAPALLPTDAMARAQVRALAQLIACEVHPVTNLRVLKYLTTELRHDEAEKNAWYHHWCRQGLEAFERQLELLARQRERDGLAASRHCFGDAPTLADCCLVPQIYNARRFEVPLDGLPRAMAAVQACEALPAFQKAHPSQCPDAPDAAGPAP
ncbi:maleylacetoacetate isomerase [Rhodoferax koreense]|uniref:Maleylacetoacetate isomerase n=1 Tax=Rhodoferax koreensis TaxID=1842727 RepID=A0A1P8JT16_9BURK|nr:maleylacetoacetate isomerase [Rhodoferax koreense]APW36861.1 maleylacetoacetate isomerase [Rhodoferax koreense]